MKNKVVPAFYDQSDLLPTFKGTELAEKAGVSVDLFLYRSGQAAASSYSTLYYGIKIMKTQFCLYMSTV